LFRKQIDHFSHARNATALLERLSGTEPTTLACRHGSAWRGNGSQLLRRLADRLST
jgi:hypothetical protein